MTTEACSTDATIDSKADLESSTVNRQQWRWSALAGMASYLDAGSIVALGVSLVPFEAHFGLTKGEVGTLAAIGPNAIGCAIGAVVGGWLGDKVGRKRIYQYDLLVYAFGILEAMSRWVDWLATQNPSGLRVSGLGNNYGDWLCIPSDTSFGTHSPMKCLLATAYFATDCAKLAEIARELGRAEDASRFRARFELVRAAFQREWLQPDGRLGVDTQTAYLLALAFDLLPDELREAAAGHLVADIRDRDFHLSCGFVGVSHLNPQLSLAGYADVAYRLLLRDDYPSWLYPVLHGATTIWERWNGWTKHEGFFNPHMNSFNHYSLGSVGEWLYRHVAGIELDPERPGFQHFVLRPFLGLGLSFARASFRTLHGVIESSWHWNGHHFSWTFRVPPNCTAKVYLPAQALEPLELDSLDWCAGPASYLLARAGRYTVKSVPI